MMKYEAKYDSGKKKIYFFTAVLCISILSASIIPSLLVYIGIIIFFSAIGMLGTIFGFRTLYLYIDRMEIQNVFGKIELEVAYDEIKRIGFLQGHEIYATSKSRSYYISQDPPMEELIILLKDNGRMQIDAGDFDEIHEVCAYIQQRVGQS